MVQSFTLLLLEIDTFFAQEISEDEAKQYEQELQLLKEQYATKRQQTQESTAQKVEELQTEIGVLKETVERLKGTRPSSAEQSRPSMADHTSFCLCA